MSFATISQSPGSLLTIARRLRAFGLSIIPVPPPRPGTPPHTPGDGKTPVIKWKHFQSRLPTDAELRCWCRPGTVSNLAAITGKISGVVVLDADSDDALDWCVRHLPTTPWWTCSAKGAHLWFKYPGVPVTNKARLHTPDGQLLIDVRGDGGYVIVPPSVHASGAVYTEVGEWTIPRDALPRFDPTWLTAEERVSRPVPVASRRVFSLPAHDRARRYLAAIPRPVIGYGSDPLTFYATCKLLQYFQLSRADTTDLIWEWAGGQDDWTRDWVERKVAHVAARYGGRR